MLTAAEVTITATTNPSERSGVRSSKTMSAMVANPIARARPSSCDGLNTVLSARTTRFGPSAW